MVLISIYVVAFLAVVVFATISLSRIITVLRQGGTAEDVLHGGHTDTSGASKRVQTLHRIRLLAMAFAPAGLLVFVIGMAYIRFSVAFWIAAAGGGAAVVGMAAYLLGSAVAGIAEGWDSTSSLRQEIRQLRKKP